MPGALDPSGRWREGASSVGAGWRLAGWAPVLAAAAIIGIAELVWAATRPSIEGTALWRSWRQWLAFSGNALLLSWTLFWWQATARRTADGVLATTRVLMPGLLAVGGVGGWLLIVADFRHDPELVPLLFVMFGPTLVLAYGVVGSGLGRLKRLWEVGVVLGVVAGMMVAGQAAWGWPEIPIEDARPLLVCSLILGLALGIRLAIWWFTDEGFATGRER